MPKVESEELIRLHVHLYQSDYDDLKLRYGDSIGMAKAIRMMIRHRVKRLREREAAQAKGLTLELSDDDIT